MAKQRLEEIRKIRFDRVKKLREMGIDPYPAKVDGKPISISRAREQESRRVEVAGRITGWRAHGNVIFADLKDETGEIQLWFQKDNLKDFKVLKLFDVGDFLFAKGKVVKTKAGELTVDVAKFQLLTKSLRPLPSSWSGFKDIEDRYRQRYVDMLLNTQVKKNLEVRAQFIGLLRIYLEDNGFIEMETPILQHIYGGASARPFVTHHNALKADLYLRISDELYLKRLVVGGFEKVYEIGKDFRNEGLESGRAPEFTMCEFYWAYSDYEQLMKFTEEMLSFIVKEISGSYKLKMGGDKLDFTPPWKRTTYRDLLDSELGIDINKLKGESQLKNKIKQKKLKVDLKGVVGFSSILDAIYKQLVRPNISGPILLTDRPSEMVPLAKRRENDPRKVATFQLVAAGEEYINAYDELNDPVDQRDRWEEDMKLGERGSKEYQVLDDDYIRALEYGMPPTAGWGLGIDRFVMLLTDAKNIKDVIAFPTLRPENAKGKKAKRKNSK